MPAIGQPEWLRGLAERQIKAEELLSKTPDEQQRLRYFHMLRQAEVGGENASVVDVLVGKLLAFFRCMHEGLRPDSPPEGGIINRLCSRLRCTGVWTSL